MTAYNSTISLARVASRLATKRPASWGNVGNRRLLDSRSARCVGPSHSHSHLQWSRSKSTALMEHDYETPASPKVERVFEKILYLDMFEVHLVTELIAEKLGMSVSAGAAAGGSVGGGAAAQSDEAEAAVEEKTAFDLKLVSFDAKSKIKVIKEIRSMAGLGLKEAKEMVEGAPKTVMKEIKKDEAEELKAKLEELGAVVEIV